MKFLPILDRLLTGWRDQGYRLGALRTAVAERALDTLPRHELRYGAVPGRSGTLLVQGATVD